VNRVVAHNFGYIATSNLLGPLLSLVLVLAIARLQGTEALGRYSVLMSVLVLGTSVAAFGLPVVLTREVTQAPAQAGSWFASAVALSLALLAPLVAAALVACGLWGGDVDMRLALALTVLTVLPSAVTQCAESVLLAYERAQDFVLINLAETSARAMLGTALVVGGHGMLAIGGLLLALRLAAALAFVVVLRRRGVRAMAGLDRERFGRLRAYVPVTGAIPIVNAVFARADVFLLASLGTWREVGLYSAALRPVDLARTITPAYARAAYPGLARARAAGRDYARVARRAVQDALVVSVPIALALYAGAGTIIHVLFGEALAPAAGVLRILAWTVIPFGVAIVLAQVLFAADRQAIDLAVNLIAVVVSVGAALVLIPRWGAAGAATAALMASLAYVTIQYAGVGMWIGLLGLTTPVVRVGAAAIAALVAGAASTFAGPVVATLTSLAVFVGAALLLVAPLFTRETGEVPAAESGRRVVP
jgi:O-antigen/teichoic acid export membrane protein